MKRILTFLLLVIALEGFSQTYPWMIKVSPDQSVDTANVGIFYPSGSANLTGRMHVVSYNNLADRLSQYITPSNWFTANGTQIGNRSHDAAGYDTQLDNQGEFKVISDVANKNIWFEKTNAGNTPINSLKITQNDIQLNSDDGVNVSSLTMGDAFIFANSSGSYVFGDGFTPVPDDNTVTKVLGLDGDGYLRQKDVSSIGGGASYLVYTALISQADTDAPTVIVLENSLSGAITWTYDGVGTYTGTLTGAFTADKTAIIFSTPLGFTAAYRGSANVITINTYDDSFTQANDMLNKVLIEIRVYP